MVRYCTADALKRQFPPENFAEIYC